MAEAAQHQQPSALKRQQQRQRREHKFEGGKPVLVRDRSALKAPGEDLLKDLLKDTYVRQSTTERDQQKVRQAQALRPNSRVDAAVSEAPAAAPQAAEAPHEPPEPPAREPQHEPAEQQQAYQHETQSLVENRHRQLPPHGEPLAQPLNEMRPSELYIFPRGPHEMRPAADKAVASALPARPLPQ
jgi:hypothetical protein